MNIRFRPFHRHSTLAVLLVLLLLARVAYCNEVANESSAPVDPSLSVPQLEEQLLDVSEDSPDRMELTHTLKGTQAVVTTILRNAEESVKANRKLLTKPAQQAVEWAVADWQRGHRHVRDIQDLSNDNGKKHVVARTSLQDYTELTETSGGTPSIFPTTTFSTPASAPTGTAGGLSSREEFLRQPPKPLGSLPSGGNSSSDSVGPVNYGSATNAIALAPTDILISDAIVNIPKGEGYEAMISANGQGLLIGLGIEEVDAQGNTIFEFEGFPKRTPLKRGMIVKRGQILGKQDDREHLANKLIADQQLIVAQMEADKQLEIEVARLAVLVAESEYYRAKSANERVIGAVTQEELVQKAYEFKRADKSAEKAKYDLDVKGKEVKVREAQVVAAVTQMENRQLLSPIDGVIDEVMQNEGQWLREGDNIVRIIRLDKIEILGKIDARLYSPEAVDGKKVTIYVHKPGGGPTQQMDGVITYARQVVESGHFSIYATVNNIKSPQGYWLLNPGTLVTMVIHR